ncbi:MAG: hypothetical protein N2449_09620, partial [Bacteroidales bacterium]|nr:hypothetical protein [Bacteroidales bacterium]
MKNFLLYIVLTLIITNKILSQNQIVILNNTTHNTSGTYCGFWFYDNGGVNGNYTNNQDFWITLMGNPAPNTHVRINFASFDIKPDDTLYIYNGPTITSPLLSKHNNNYNPLNGSNTMVMATLSNPSGALTVRLKTNNANTGSGWNATIICGQACQSIVPQIDMANTTPTPHLENGFWYIDICEGQTINFAALADNTVFPENNILYNQSAASCTFNW